MPIRPGWSERLLRRPAHAHVNGLRRCTLERECRCAVPCVRWSKGSAQRQSMLPKRRRWWRSRAGIAVMAICLARGQDGLGAALCNRRSTPLEASVLSAEAVL